MIGDRGYVSIKGMEYIMECNADFILRYRKNAFNIYDENRIKVNILTEIRNLQKFESMSFKGFYKVKNEYRPVRLTAMKKSREDDEKAVKKIENDCRRKKRNTPKQDTLELNKYIILVTSLDYSIELVFKRLKSLFELSKIPSAKSETAQAWFYGKLFLAVICETILKAEVFSPEKENPEE
ncbi:MAG: transposase [Ruminococcus sp.]|nr:transposase [Ruminococcus sp.]